MRRERVRTQGCALRRLPSNHSFSPICHADPLLSYHPSSPHTCPCDGNEVRLPWCIFLCESECPTCLRRTLPSHQSSSTPCACPQSSRLPGRDILDSADVHAAGGMYESAMRSACCELTYSTLQSQLSILRRNANLSGTSQRRSPVACKVRRPGRRLSKSRCAQTKPSSNGHALLHRALRPTVPSEEAGRKSTCHRPLLAATRVVEGVELGGRGSLPPQGRVAWGCATTRYIFLHCRERVVC